MPHASVMTSHTIRSSTALAAVLVLAGAVGAASAGAASSSSSYAVRSVVLTYNSAVKTTAAALPDGTTGTLTTTLSATLRGAAGPEGPVQLPAPEVANQYACSPSCPSFVATGPLRVERTFTPTGRGQKKTCRFTKAAKATGRVYVTSAKTGPRTLRLSLQDATGPNDLYVLSRAACKLPELVPVDSSDFSSFGEVALPASRLGSKTIAIDLRNSLKPPTYPWAATGTTRVTANVVLDRKG